MTIDKEHIANQVTADKKVLPVLQEKVAGKIKDKNGGNSSALSLAFRSIGICEYLLHNDPKMFRNYLKEAAKLRLGLFLRFEVGEPIDKSYLAMGNYQSLFNALAAAEFGLAHEFASVMGGRDKLEKYHDHPFDYAFGYTLKWFVLKNRTEMEKWLAVFQEVCRKKAPAGFAGYTEFFEAVLAGSQSQAEETLPILIKGHERMSKRGIFALSDDRHLCVWGLGLVNLARGLYGLDVPAAPPLIPADLLASLE